MTQPRSAEVRSALLDAYAAAVAAVEGERVTREWLVHHPLAEAAVIALGKAAGAMMLGAQQALGAGLRRGLVLTKAGHAEDPRLDRRRIRICEGAHPIPDRRSLEAGQALCDFVAELPPGLAVLVLISGGASALVELPQPGVTLDDLARVNAWLLAHGLPIGEINAVRRRLSRLKGGGLAGLLGARPVTGLIISDVEGDDPALIGSGPLTAPATSRLPDGLPDWMTPLLGSARDSAPVGSAEVHVIATLDDALRAAERALIERGFTVRRHDRHFAADVDRVARQVAGALSSIVGVVQLWGGEATVQLPDQPGRGGRNQQLALHLATLIAGDRPALVLCAGTDGTDGPTEDAGALVDNQTVARGRARGLSAARSLHDADAGSFLEQTGDLVTTGPTGTNVTDLVIAWRA